MIRLPSEFRTPLPLLSIDQTLGNFGVVQLFLDESLHCGDPSFLVPAFIDQSVVGHWPSPIVFIRRPSLLLTLHALLLA
jgi:hypothetical protein